MTIDINTTKLASFAGYIESLKPGIKRQYDRSINRDLSQQKAQNLFKRNIDSVLQQTYENSLNWLRELLLKDQHLNIKTAFSEQISAILRIYDGVIEELLQYALRKHRTSCALSNFPSEHKPSEAYLGEVLQVISQRRQQFKHSINILLA